MILGSKSDGDIKLLSPKRETPSPLEPIPEGQVHESTLRNWQATFKRRKEWATRLSDKCQTSIHQIQKTDKEISVIIRAAAIAVENIQQHVRNLQPKYQETKTWADQILGDQTYLLENWQSALRVLGSISVREELGQCFHGAPNNSKGKRASKDRDAQPTLRDFLDIDEVESAARSGKELSGHFNGRITDLESAFEEVITESTEIVERFQQDDDIASLDNTRDQADHLLEEIEVLMRKLDADNKHVFSMLENQKSVPQASKIASIHKTNFLPSLQQIHEEVSQLLVRTSEGKEHLALSSTRYLQKISVIESAVSSVHSKLAKLDIVSQDARIFDVLNHAMRLPFIYGSLLVECVKRQEWAEKMTADSSSLVEEVATFREEEITRRKKWVKDMGSVFDFGPVDEMALGIDISVHPQKQHWPTISRRDITDLVQRLKNLGDLDGVSKEIEDHAKLLDAPSREQVRRAKAFKNGSVHEAAYGRTSLLLRGDDDVLLALQNEKSRYEEKLKSAESRVRKLEDLLHRQSQMDLYPRLPSATGSPASNAPSFQRHVTTPVPNFSSALTKAREDGSQRPSVSRRFSMTNDPEGLAQRVVKLEAELTNEKARSADLINQAAAKSDTEDLLRSQVREAISTKEDLLGNLEAQQHEFDDERRLLKEQNNNLTIKCEELEDELEEELDQVKANAAKDAQKMESDVQALRSECEEQRSRAEELAREVRLEKDTRPGLDMRITHLSSRLSDNNQAQQSHQRSLRNAFSHLSPVGNIPNNYGTLIETVEAVAKESAAHLKSIQIALNSIRAENTSLETRIRSQDEELTNLKGVEGDLDTLRVDNESLEARIRSQADEIYDLRERLGKEQRGLFSTHEELTSQQAQCANLQKQVDFERHEHDRLKTDFASGKTDSAALRSRLTDSESKVAELLRNVAQLESHSQQLATSLAEREAGLEDSQQSRKDLLIAKNSQASKATNISRIMMVHNQILERLIEQVGLMIHREDDTMTIEKAPRATGTSTVLIDPSSSMRRSSSAPMPTASGVEQNVNTEILDWSNAEDVEDLEKRFYEFMKQATSLDLDVFSEAIYKRVKEIEHIARKWQKEARAYRDKYHRAQSEAHERIALRNFKEGDLALFLPTRDQATKPWAAFNVGAPHCFLREQDSHNLSKRDWLIARISKVEERVVDLSKSINGGLKGSGEQKSTGDKTEAGTFPNDENPYELSDGLRWYLIDAAEEKPGAPINIGTGKVTVASANVDAKGSIRMKKSSSGNGGATKTLTRSLDSRRSSTNSKKGLVAVTSNSTTTGNPANAGLEGMLEQSIDNAAAAAAAATTNLASNKDGSSMQDTERPRSSQTMETIVSGVGGQNTENVG